jgi:hypothetical protein
MNTPRHLLKGFTMRSYPRNSPEAAARIVALVLIADGHVCRSELDTLRQLELERELALPPGGFARVVQTLCEDQLLCVCARGLLAAQIGEDQLAGFMAEVDDPALQRRVLHLASAAALADHHLADAEGVVLEAALRHWGRFSAAAESAAANPRDVPFRSAAWSSLRPAGERVWQRAA